MSLETRSISAAHYLINGVLSKPRPNINLEMFACMRVGDLAYLHTGEKQETAVRIDEVIFIESQVVNNWDIVIRGHTDNSKQKIRDLVKG
ncbi:hypothetical protein [Pseudomonas putida]|uniref:hypothetical protein n=1 Tax=Pseudomonas putida TaxID=303 RepID=UPI0023662F87|nr:hypothetical protein [Pseudomonas putida]MDD2050285.1 hypothetical protein [Pseudomonas putida]